MMGLENKGFTLLELMIASAILLIAGMALLFTLVNCTLLNENNNELIRAANDAQYVLEQIKSLAFDDIESYSPPASGFSNLLNENIPAPTVTSINSRLKEITVNVNWTNKRGRASTFRLTTRIVKQ